MPETPYGAAAGRRYSKVAMLFHWVIAVAVIVNWRLAENAGHADSREAGMAIMGTHKALGITILALTLARLAWRLTHPVPPLSSALKPWERALARTTHIVFYVLLIGLPLGAWLANSMMGQAIDVFGLFTLPALPVGSNPGLGKTIFEAHGTAGSIMIWLIALHVLGALKHTFIDRDGTLFKMLPFGRVRA